MEGPPLATFSPDTAVKHWWDDCKTTRRINLERSTDPGLQVPSHHHVDPLLQRQSQVLQSTRLAWMTGMTCLIQTNHRFVHVYPCIRQIYSMIILIIIILIK